MNPKISIIVPIYNVEKYISRCAKSLFEQTYKNIEYIFVNDCSPDNSINILRETIEQYPERKNNILIIDHKKNRGLAAARNTGLDNASGDFVAHVDSDDFVNKEYISSFVVKQKLNDADIVVGNVIFDYQNRLKPTLQEKYKTKSDFLGAVLARKTNTNVCGKIIRRSLYEENNIRNIEGINNSEDYQVFPQLLYFSRSYAFDPDAKYFYYQGNTYSYSNSHKEASERQIFETIDILCNFFKKHDSNYLPYLNDARLAVLTWNLKHWCYVKGHDDFFNEIKSNILSYDRNYLKALDWKTKLALYGSRRVIQVLYSILHR